jgi:ECF sigma factor
MWAQDEEIARVLEAWRTGDRGAVRLVYDELRVHARRQLRRSTGSDSVGPTTLAHELHLRFANRAGPHVLDRSHFVAIAASAMRMLIVDHRRRKHSQKRDPQATVSISLDTARATCRQLRANRRDLAQFLCNDAFCFARNRG